MNFALHPFESVFADESSGNVKTPQGEYFVEGKFPVVDQGKNLIGGYTNDPVCLCGEGRPAIVFGDHTRCVKYVDFPFCMGADGVKVLRPKIDADLKYLYYYLASLQLPSGGYNRHYKYLKRTEILLPSLPDQRRIAVILDQADTLRAKRREALAHLDNLTQSIFMEMFGTATIDRLEWLKLRLSEVADVLTGYPFKSDEYVASSNSAVRLCRGANVMPGRVDWQDLACWPKAGMESLSTFVLDAGDIVMAMDRPWISEGFKIARITQSDCPALLVQRVARIRSSGKALDDFLYGLLLQPAFAQHCRPTETTIPHISPKEIRSFEFRLPPLALQQTFATHVQAVQSLKTIHAAALTELDTLFASLQHRAFRGEL